VTDFTIKRRGESAAGTRRGKRVLILSDGRPGHYHLAEGVAAAAGRRVAQTVERIEIRRRRPMTSRLLNALLAIPGLGPARVLKLGYGLEAVSLPACDLIISAGGDTILANIALARLRRVPNIFCGTLRHARPSSFALVVSSYARHQGRPNHLVTLKPSGLDPDALRRAPLTDRPGPSNPPQRPALLVGGDSGLFRYADDEWSALLGFLPAFGRETGARWLVSTSRRTAHAVADRFAALAAREPTIARFIDYRTAGPGTLPDLFAEADMVLCTEDSSTMISEAICARLPVVGVSPREHDFKPEELEYRQLMLEKGWCRFMGLAELSTARILEALAGITPLKANHLDLLAAELETRLPAYFA
jgi:hypothetical protein